MAGMDRLRRAEAARRARPCGADARRAVLMHPLPPSWFPCLRARTRRPRSDFDPRSDATMRRLVALVLLWPLLHGSAAAQAARDSGFTHADSLRGSNGPARAWWDATFYDLHVTVAPADSSIRGWNGITYRVLEPGSEMQIDLQPPLVVDSVVQDGRTLDYRRDGGSAYFVELSGPQEPGSEHTVTVYYRGRPVVAVRPPWDGGYIWQRDSLGYDFVATANEGLGASAWWPNKDYLADEPDSQRVAITVPDPIIDVSNGRLRSSVPHADGTTTYEWFVTEPINNYDVAVNAGRYAHWTEMYAGEAGPLTMDFFPLAYHYHAARKQWAQVRTMMRCFEHWFGPYPWYADGYKLVEAPHLGMEHQSAIAYGNQYVDGYLGHDVSGTGLGLQWDFIVVHESAHEWWGNNITMKDAADMWIHESFAAYAESLYTECVTGNEQAGARYVLGTRERILNDRPIIGPYGVNHEGSGDMYYKGGNMLHTLRQVVNDDAKWRDILRGLNRTFRHRTVTTRQIEDYISGQAGIDLKPFFDQYLRTTKIPVLEYAVEGGTLRYRWTNAVPGFDMPVRVTLSPGRFTRIRPTETWQSVPIGLDAPQQFQVDPNFYVTARRVQAPGAG